jgi:hypothetical protein
MSDERPVCEECVRKRKGRRQVFVFSAIGRIPEPDGRLLCGSHAAKLGYVIDYETEEYEEA